MCFNETGATHRPPYEPSLLDAVRAERICQSTSRGGSFWFSLDDAIVSIRGIDVGSSTTM